MKADIFVLGDGLLDRRQMWRRRLINVGHDQLWIGSAEDQVLRKLDWFRSGDEVSERPWRDVVGLLGVQGDRVDREDLESTAAALGLSDLLARALREADGE